jgi:hypothetical protein
MFKHKINPEVQKQLNDLRRDLIDVAKMLKEYEDANTRAVRQIAKTLELVASAVEKLGEERGIVRRDRWKQ